MHSSVQKILHSWTDFTSSSTASTCGSWPRWLYRSFAPPQYCQRSECPRPVTSFGAGLPLTGTPEIGPAWITYFANSAFPPYFLHRDLRETSLRRSWTCSRRGTEKMSNTCSRVVKGEAWARRSKSKTRTSLENQSRGLSRVRYARAMRCRHGLGLCCD